MKLCPFCAEEIQDAAIRCKHCRSDLVPAVEAGPAVESTSRRPPRRVVAGLVALAVLVAAGPVVARPLIRHLRAEGCQPSGWMEWHQAMRKQCLSPSYVCENMTTSKMLSDPDVAHGYHGDPGSSAHLSELVGRMRSAYGCAPETGRSAGPGLGGTFTPGFPIAQDAPRSL